LPRPDAGLPRPVPRACVLESLARPMVQLTALSKSFGERVLFDEVTGRFPTRVRRPLRPQRLREDDLAPAARGLDEPDSGPSSSRRACGSASCAGRPGPQRPHGSRGGVARFSALLDLKAEMQTSNPAWAIGHPRRRARADARQVQRCPGSVPDPGRLQHGPPRRSVLAGLGSARPISRSHRHAVRRLADAPGPRQAAARATRSAPARRADEPPRPRARNWLESFLAAYPYCVILVSHDRFFLDAVVTRITEVSLRTLTDYHGNYSHFLAESQARLERLRDAKRQQDEEVARMRQFIDRFRYQATKAAQVQSRIRCSRRSRRSRCRPSASACISSSRPA